MKTALIVMTILGCDDGVNECAYIASPEQRWVSIELCHAASERVLDGYSNASYPMVIAVCQPPATGEAEVAATPKTAPAESVVPAPSIAEPTKEERKGLAARALDTIKLALPGKEKVRMAFETPLHVISDSYSWVARKIGD